MPTARVWHDGPLTLAVRHGAICYLDEIVEARQDTTVVIHPLTDARRMLPLDKQSELVRGASPTSSSSSPTTPAIRASLKDLKESTRQRFAALEFDYPAPRYRGRDRRARRRHRPRPARGAWSRIAERSRNLRGHGLDEGASTRMLVHAGRLMAHGVSLPPPPAALALVAAHHR